MTRRRSLAFPFALLLAAFVAGTSVAGGWAQVTVTDPPVDPPAGAGTTVGLQVMQHGVTPVSWPKLTVVATDKVTGQSISSQATPDGPEGHYVATITFPSAGAWTLTFVSQDLAMSGFADVQVGPALAAAPSAAPATPVATNPAPGSIDPLVWLGIAALAALAIGLVAVGLRGRRPSTQPG